MASRLLSFSRVSAPETTAPRRVGKQQRQRLGRLIDDLQLIALTRPELLHAIGIEVGKLAAPIRRAG